MLGFVFCFENKLQKETFDCNEGPHKPSSYFNLFGHCQVGKQIHDNNFDKAAMAFFRD